MFIFALLFGAIGGGGFFGSQYFADDDDRKKTDGFADFFFNNMGFEGAGIFNLLAGFLNMFGANIPTFDLEGVDGNRSIFEYVAKKEADAQEAGKEYEAPVSKMGKEMAEQLGSDLGLPEDVANQIAANPEAIKEIPNMLKAAGVTFNGLALPGNMSEKLFSSEGIEALLATSELKSELLSADGLEALLGDEKLLAAILSDLEDAERSLAIQAVEQLTAQDYTEIANELQNGNVATLDELVAVLRPAVEEAAAGAIENGDIALTPEILLTELRKDTPFTMGEGEGAITITAEQKTAILQLIGEDATVENPLLVAVVNLKDAGELESFDLESLQGVLFSEKGAALRTAMLARLQAAPTDVQTSLQSLSGDENVKLVELLFAVSDVGGKSNLEVLLEKAQTEPIKVQEALEFLAYIQATGENKLTLKDSIDVEQIDLELIQALDANVIAGALEKGIKDSGALNDVKGEAVTNGVKAMIRDATGDVFFKGMASVAIPTVNKGNNSVKFSVEDADNVDTVFNYVAASEKAKLQELQK